MCAWAVPEKLKDTNVLNSTARRTRPFNGPLDFGWTSDPIGIDRIIMGCVGSVNGQVGIYLFQKSRRHPKLCEAHNLARPEVGQARNQSSSLEAIFTAYGVMVNVAAMVPSLAPPDGDDGELPQPAATSARTAERPRARRVVAIRRTSSRD